jgi:hypothetical protein
MVISGHYRTFDQTWKNIKEFINTNDLDVYCHLWSDNDPDKNREQLHNVRDRLNPKRILQEPQDMNMFLPIEERVKSINPKPMAFDRVAGAAAMYYSRQTALELVDEEYENVVHCRYDLGFRQMFQFHNIDKIVTPLEESYNLISDIFAIMPFEYTKYYFLYNDYERLQSTYFEPEFLDWLRNIKQYPERDVKIHIEQRYCPHMLLLRNLMINNVPTVIENIPVYIHR